MGNPDLPKLGKKLRTSPSPPGRRWREAPDEGRAGQKRCAFRPSPAASRHPLPEGEGLASAASHYCKCPNSRRGLKPATTYLPLTTLSTQLSDIQRAFPDRPGS